MINQRQTFQLTFAQRNQISHDFSGLLKEKFLLQQELRQQQDQATVANESLFLECLEVFDALEFLLKYMTEHFESDQQSWEQLFKSLGSIERKFLALLSKHQVNPIDEPDSSSNFSECKVVGQVVSSDIETGTIVEIVRQGFHFGDKVLRPIEVVVAQPKC